jgi:SAM-dependent MidA family methyltransferase
MPASHQLDTIQYLMPDWMNNYFSGRSWISFSEWMQAALYHPTHGYYRQPVDIIGTTTGDFVTAPQLTPLFGYTIAKSIIPWLTKTNLCVLEFGAGTGQLAVDLFKGLLSQGLLLDHYLILELSQTLRQQQQIFIRTHLPEHIHHFDWLDTLPDEFSGVMLGNEVLDAMPVDCFTLKNTTLFETGIFLKEQGNQLIASWSARPISDSLKAYFEKNVSPYLSAFVQEENNSYTSELHLQSCAWLKTLASILKQGAILLIDYGFSAQTYYHPQRSMGTLTTHFRHRSGLPVLAQVGQQDITAHVNFSALYQTTVEFITEYPQSNFQLAGYTTQSHFLIASGILSDVPPRGTRSPLNNMGGVPINTALQLLLAEHEMGELFKVIGFVSSADLLSLCPGFDGRDDSGTL